MSLLGFCLAVQPGLTQSSVSVSAYAVGEVMTVRKDGQGDYRTIQEAINNARFNATIKN